MLFLTWKVAGMLVGVYTGGTPNLVSLRLHLDVDPNLFLMTSTYDMIVGAITLIFFITVGPRIFRAILPPFKYKGESDETDQAIAEAESFEDFSGMFRKGQDIPLLKALGISAADICSICWNSHAVSRKCIQMVLSSFRLLLWLSLASLIPWLNRIEKTFQLGMYFILVFSFAVASMADLSIIFNIGFLGLFAYIFYAYFGSLILHIILIQNIQGKC